MQLKLQGGRRSCCIDLEKVARVAIGHMNQSFEVSVPKRYKDQVVIQYWIHRRMSVDMSALVMWPKV